MRAVFGWRTCIMCAGVLALSFGGVLLNQGRAYAQTQSDCTEDEKKIAALRNRIEIYEKRLGEAEVALNQPVLELEQANKNYKDAQDNFNAKPDPKGFFTATPEYKKTQEGIKNAEEKVKLAKDRVTRIRNNIEGYKKELDALLNKPCPPKIQLPQFKFQFFHIPSIFAGNTHIGLNFGGMLVANIPTASSSGFYSGGTDTVAAPMIGGSLFYDFARVGTSSEPFGSYTFSAGLVVDYVGGASMNWTGRCGGFACDGNGRLNELNYIAELKVTTPLGGGNSINGYIGAGAATLWPSGTPTGTGGPAFRGSSTAPAFRVGWGIDHQFNPNWSGGFKIGVQFTGSTEFDTTLPGERFRLDHKTEGIFGLNITYTPTGR